MLHATHESMMHYRISPKFFLTHVSGKRTRDCSSLICCTAARPSRLAFFSLCMKLGSYLSFHMNDFTNWSKPSRAAFDFCVKASERFQSPDIHISLVSASASCSFNWYPWSALRAFDSPRRGPSFLFTASKTPLLSVATKPLTYFTRSLAFSKRLPSLIAQHPLSWHHIQRTRKVGSSPSRVACISPSLVEIDVVARFSMTLD